MLVDLFMVYQFIRRLATPFNEWEAFKLGIIDADGNVLKKRKDLMTIKERDSFGVFDVMVLNIKKLLAKLPGGSTKIASYAAALYLIREWKHFTPDSQLTEDLSEAAIKDSLDLFIEGYSYYTTLAEDVNKNMNEDGAPANAAAGGANIAGLTPDSIGLNPLQMNRYKKKNRKYSPMPKLKTFKEFAEENVNEAPLTVNDTISDPSDAPGSKSIRYRKKRLNKKHPIELT